MKNEVSPGLIAGVAVVAIGLLGFITYRVFAGPHLSPSEASKATPPPSIDRATFYANGGMSGSSRSSSSSYSSYGSSGTSGGYRNSGTPPPGYGR